ncbi:MAG: DmsE family decaheme c-type cytochrome [Acidobacteria bacterium]|nr:DmsE family decaheme c-type cytochrome [Acidobacteriota bacterium]
MARAAQDRAVAQPAAAPSGSQAAASGYVGEATCVGCHSLPAWQETTHARVFAHSRTAREERGCEACHGPGERHAADPSDPGGILRFGPKSRASTADQNTACLQCHEKGIRVTWQLGPHASRGVTCVNCHKVMETVSTKNLFAKATEMEVCFQCHQQRRGQIRRSSHMPFREQKMTCTSCHNPHGTANPKLLLTASVNEGCYSCHAEKRGPFLWEHAPVRENCLNCHDPHGSNHDKLLAAKRASLCQRCHVESRHPVTPHLATTRFVFNRSCQNCHSQIHGSNHPSGVRFQR